MSRRDRYFDTLGESGDLVDAEAVIGERYFQEGYRGRALRRKVKQAMAAIVAYDWTRMADVIPLWELDRGRG